MCQVGLNWRVKWDPADVVDGVGPTPNVCPPLGATPGDVAFIKGWCCIICIMQYIFGVALDSQKRCFIGQRQGSRMQRSESVAYLDFGLKATPFGV